MAGHSKSCAGDEDCRLDRTQITQILRISVERKTPPRLFLRFFRWYCHPRLADHIEGDLQEIYGERAGKSGKRWADLRFIADVLSLFRPGIIGRQKRITQPSMFRNDLKTGWRIIVRDKGYSMINIGGLAIGMTVAILIGLWLHDELSFNKYHDNYDHIAQMWTGGTDPLTSEGFGGIGVPFAMGAALKTYPQHFKHVMMAWWISDYVISSDEKKISQTGEFIDSEVIDVFSLKMVSGSKASLDHPHSIILSESAAAGIFGDEDPMHKTLRINNRMEVEVTGIYEDIPRNSYFGEVQFFCPWSLFYESNEWVRNNEHNWDNKPFNIYVQLQPNTTVEAAEATVHDLFFKHVPADFLQTITKFKPFVTIIPMSTWHLYSDIKEGEPSGGRIAYVWLFGTIGVFVLVLACINFINLSTARSEKRSREVGVRKSVGSSHRQLIIQFLSESLLVVLIAFAMSSVLVAVFQPFFNQLTDKDIALPFSQPLFWLLALGFIITTTLLAGLYPAFYLSSFKPVRALKGTHIAGRLAALPRQTLVVFQFTISVVLIIGTWVVYQQVQYARNRPVGYDREGLISVSMNDPGYRGKEEVLKTELLRTGVVSDMSVSSSPVTTIWNNISGFDWKGKDPALDANFWVAEVNFDFGKTVGWTFVGGRDYSRELATDSTESIIINEAAAAYMGMKDAVGEELIDTDSHGRPKRKWTIIGVVKNMVNRSAYEPAVPSLFRFQPDASGTIHVRINPAVSAGDALPKIQAVFNKVVPDALFDYTFVDETYGQKFSQELRIGQLAGWFSILATLISCLGLFGLASFVAEQRTKEIGIRKVMGASVAGLWQMLSRDFTLLVLISCCIAIPLGYYAMNTWLGNYQYRTEIPWWVPLASSLAALLITLLTVSYQSIRAARANPVKSLRAE
jgi:putative ABC transport system permease protein